MLHPIRRAMHDMAECAYRLEAKSYAVPCADRQRRLRASAGHLRAAVGVWLACLESDWLREGAPASLPPKHQVYQGFSFPLQLAEQQLGGLPDEVPDFASMKQAFAYYQQIREALIGERPEALRECLADMAALGGVG